MAMRSLERGRVPDAAALFETMTLGVVFQDASGRIVSANPAAERILGYSLEQMQGRTSSAVEWKAIHEDGSDFLGESHPAMVALRTARPVRGVVMGVDHGRTGERVWIRIDAVPCCEPGHEEPHLVYTTFEDVTAYKAAEEELRASEQRLRLANEIARVGTYEVDVLRGAVHASKQMCDLYGVADGTIRTLEDWVALVHPGDRERMRDELARSLEPRGDGWVRAEHRACTTGGEVRWLAWLGRTFFDETGGARRAVRHVGAVNDISSRVEAVTLREAARRKDDFLALLSHELRNPLTPIVGCVRLLERTVQGGEKVTHALAVLDRQTRQLSKLVDDLLDITRLARGKVQLQPEPLDLNELVQTVVEDHRTMFEDQGVAVVLEPPRAPVPVKVDRARLVQVTGNLLQNAAKFTARGGRARVSVAEDAASGQAVLEVTDTGVGMTPDMLARVFEPFAQAESSMARSRGGLGLGLTLVRALVELHGGTVRAHSAGLETGTTIVVSLPLDRPDERPSDETRSSVAAPKRKLLVIEDNVDAAEMLQQVLELEGHDVAVAHSGPDGLAQMRRIHPDVVICDLGLPGMSGYDVAREVRKDASLVGTFLVALSGYSQPEDVERAMEAGFDRHLAKPPKLEQIESLLARPDRRR